MMLNLIEAIIKISKTTFIKEDEIDQGNFFINYYIHCYNYVKYLQIF